MKKSFAIGKPDASGPVIQESVTYGARTAPRHSKKKTAKPPPADSPFQNQEFKSFMRKLVAVPKSEIVAEEKKYKRRRAARRARRKKSA